MWKKALALAALLSAALAPRLAAQDVAPNRSGFTLILDLGVGFQRDEYFGETEVGAAGLNLGLGGHVNDDFAVLFRVMGTTVSLQGGTQISGVAGPTLQYWVSDAFHLEFGLGVGVWEFEGASDRGPGLILAGGYSVWNNAGHNLYIGLEYAPAFTDPGSVHNVGLVFGWQLL